MKAKPYQFGVAAMSGLRDHSHFRKLRTNRNQRVNIYQITVTFTLDLAFDDSSLVKIQKAAKLIPQANRQTAP